MGPAQHVPIVDDDEMPLLLIAGRRRLGPVPDNLGQDIPMNRGPVEIPAGPTRGQRIQNLPPSPHRLIGTA